jgi:hypothetical protein
MNFVHWIQMLAERSVYKQENDIQCAHRLSFIYTVHYLLLNIYYYSLLLKFVFVITINHLFCM